MSYIYLFLILFHVLGTLWWRFCQCIADIIEHELSIQGAFYFYAVYGEFRVALDTCVS